MKYLGIKDYSTNSNTQIEMLRLFKLFEENCLQKKYHNLLRLFYVKGIFLEQLVNEYNNVNLEMFLFLQLSNTRNLLPDNYQTLLKEKIDLKNFLTQISKTELNLCQEAILTLTNSYNIYLNCFLRNINYFKLDYKFLHLCTQESVSIKKIDKWIEDKKNFYDLSIEDSEIAKDLFSQSSKFELFLAENNFQLPQIVINEYKYNDIESLKSINIKNLISICKEQINGKPPIPIYKELISKIKEYNPNSLTTLSSNNSISDICALLDKIGEEPDEQKIELNIIQSNDIELNKIFNEIGQNNKYKKDKPIIQIEISQEPEIRGKNCKNGL